MVACAVAGCFFSYGFLLRVSPGVMVGDLMREFGATALILGNLSAFYFYPYAVLQIPIGLWMDRTGPRATMTLACAVVALGCYVFASSESLQCAYAGRFLIGVGCALTWPGFLMVVHQWFPSRFAFLAGIGQVGAMFGGILGQAPLAAAVGRYGWQNTMLALAATGVLLSVALSLSVRNRVMTSQVDDGSWHSLKTVMREPHSWFAAVFSLSMAAQILAFGGLWGVPFLSLAYGIERTSAAGIVSLMFAGSALGAVLTGWWSDRTSTREIPMMVSALLCLGAGCSVIIIPDWRLPILSALTLLWGLGTGGLVLGFAVAREANPSNASGLVVGLVNTFVVGSGAVFQLLIGFLLDFKWQGAIENGVRLYASDHYRLALMSLMVVVVIGMACVVGIRVSRTASQQL